MYLITLYRSRSREEGKDSMHGLILGWPDSGVCGRLAESGMDDRIFFGP